jgi:hypothetical protein
MKKLLSSGVAILAATILSAVVTPVNAKPKALWEAGKFANPESVARDTKDGTLYVSNINGEMQDKDGNGYISKVSPDGTQIEEEWIKGFNAPKGLAVANGMLYVADIDQLVVVDIAKKAIVKTYDAKDAKFLNDVAADSSGRVYVSDSFTNTIWMLDGTTFSPWLVDAKLDAPNGLLVQGDKMIVATIGKMPEGDDPGSPGHLIEVGLADKSIRNVGDGSPIGFLDGVEPLGNGAYLATDFIRASLYQVEASGKFKTLVTFSKGAADLAYDPASKTVIVPLTAANQVVAYQLD